MAATVPGGRQRIYSKDADRRVRFVVLGATSLVLRLGCPGVLLSRLMFPRYNTAIYGVFTVLVFLLLAVLTPRRKQPLAHSGGELKNKRESGLDSTRSLRPQKFITRQARLRPPKARSSWKCRAGNVRKIELGSRDTSGFSTVTNLFSMD